MGVPTREEIEEDRRQEALALEIRKVEALEAIAAELENLNAQFPLEITTYDGED